MTTSYRSLTILFVSVLALVGYNFLGAAWTDAPANPPSNNVDAPINVGTDTQVKNGRLNLRAGADISVGTSTVMFRTNGNAMGNIFAAATEMRSNRYCNAMGTECSDASDIYNITNATTTIEGLQLGDDNIPTLTRATVNSLCSNLAQQQVYTINNVPKLDVSKSRREIALLYMAVDGQEPCLGGDGSCEIAYNGSEFYLSQTFIPDTSQCR